jgi:hypothetical protein
VVPFKTSYEVADDKERWDSFCAETASAWFWHTTAWRDYTLSYGAESDSRSLAFGVMQGDRLVAAVPLMAEERPGAGGAGRELSFGGGACWAPALDLELDAQGRAAVLRYAFDEIDRIAEAEGARRASLQLSPLVPGFESAMVSLLAVAGESGYLDASLSTRVLDISPSPEELQRELHPKHRRSLTKAAEGAVEVRIHDSESADAAAFNAYQALHRKASGRDTRPPQTWDLQREWIASGQGLLVCAELDGAIAGCIYVIRYGDGAYYASAANDPDADVPLGHFLNWHAILRLRELACRRYELGLLQQGVLPHDPASSKELGIARFKRRFGGVSVPLAVREKYYSTDFYNTISSQRAGNYGAPEA